MNKFRKGRFTQQWDDTIVDALESGNLTILTGSAISMYSPTNLPLGSKAAQEIKKILREDFVLRVAQNDVKSRNRLRKRIDILIGQLPFESVMGLLVDSTSRRVAERIIHAISSTSEFNLVHEILAAWMNLAPAINGPSLAIITTNYDVGLENAIRKTHPNLRYRRIITEKDTLNPLGSEPVLFKIHGTDASTGRRGYVLTHDEESELPSWKNILLHQLVDNRTVLISGYSGLDLDILPALAKCTPIKMLSIRDLQGLQRVSPHSFSVPLFRLSNKEILGGNADLQEDAFKRLSQFRIRIKLRKRALKPGNSQKRIKSAVQILSAEQRSLWFAFMVIHSGAWILGKRILDLTPGIERPSKMAARADALFYGGKYLECAKQWRLFLNNPNAKLTSERKVYAFCHAAGSLNCAGDLLGTWLMLLKASGYLPEMILEQNWVGLRKSIGEMFSRAVFSVPFTSGFLRIHRVEKVTSEFIRRMGSYPRATVIRQYVERSKGALSLGQRAALVNDYRYAGREAISMLETGDHSAIIDASKFLSISIYWAKILDDYPGLAKGYLEFWRLYVLVGEQVKALECWRKGWNYAQHVEYVGWRSFSSRFFTALTERFGRILPKSKLWQGTASDWSFKLGKQAISFLSVR